MFTRDAQFCLSDSLQCWGPWVDLIGQPSGQLHPLASVEEPSEKSSLQMPLDPCGFSPAGLLSQPRFYFIFFGGPPRRSLGGDDFGACPVLHFSVLP